MKPIWIIENFNDDNGYNMLAEEVKRQDMRCIVLDITNHFTLNRNLIKENDCVVFQGSIQLFKELKASLPVWPLGWLTTTRYLCTTYYSYFQEYLFNNKHIFMSVAGIKANKWAVYSWFAKDTTIYVRPDSGEKLFTGQLLDLQYFDKFWDNNISCGAKSTDLVVISTPKALRGEWRYICTNQKEIIGTSLYRYNDKQTYIPSAPERATALCNKVLEIGWYPDPVFTIDICEDFDGNYWLLEMNSFTSAGTYAAKKDKIVERVSQIAVEEYERIKTINTSYP